MKENQLCAYEWLNFDDSENLDCHGVMTPSSGPPIRTSFLMRRKFPLHAEEVKWNAFHNAHFYCTSMNIEDLMALTVSHSITFHVVVRFVTIKYCQEAVALQIA